MTLRQKLNAYLAKTILVPSTKHKMQIHVTREDFIHAKYLCTSEEKEFIFYKGSVFFKGYELKSL